MTEQEAISRVEDALTVELGAIDAHMAAPVAWREMKAISQELAEKHGISPDVFTKIQLDAMACL